MKINNKFKIKIIGIGDAGISIIKDLGKRDLPNIECLDMNTEWATKTANKFVKIGVNLTRGLGAGALVEIGKKAAEEDKNAIVEAIKDYDLLIIVAGLGGGTGSGASPVVAQAAKDLNIPTIAFVTLPIELEGKIRCKNAQFGMENLKNIVDILIVLPCEKLLPKNLDWARKMLVEFYENVDKILQKNILKVANIFNKNTSQKEPKQMLLKDIKCVETDYFEIFKNE